MRWTLITAAGLVALAFLATFATMAFVFTIATATITVKVDITVSDRQTHAPVPTCRLVFERGEVAGYGQAFLRTDGAGQAVHEATHSYVGSMFWPFDRDRDPVLRFHIGEAPLTPSAEAQSWEVRLRFREPWTRREVAPQVEVRRLAPPGAPPFPNDGAPAVRASVRFEPKSGGGELYRVPLSIELDAAQIATCRAEPTGELETRANRLFNAGRYKEALEAYREAAARTPDKAWAHVGIGDCLVNLDRGKEAVPSYRLAVKLAPNDPDVQYAYGNSLLWGRYAEAEKELRKAIALEPDKARGYIGLGAALYQLDRYRESMAAYEKAVKLCSTCLRPDDRETYEDARTRASR